MKTNDNSGITISPPGKPIQSINQLVINALPWVGFLSGLIMWLIDAAVDVMFIHTDEKYWESVFSEDDTEMWMRTLVVIVMTSSAVVVQFFMRKQHKFEQELLNYKDHLEEIIYERTRKLQYLANFDELTGIYNRRKFNDCLQKEMERAKRYQQPLSLVLCDIDLFKNVNDTCGHDVGDQILKSFAAMLSEHLRKSDIYARWGGEEFIMLMPHTDLNTAKNVADKLRQLVNTISYGEDNQYITASFGVSQQHNAEQISPLIKRADNALYEAKHSGRNRVSINA